MKKTGSKIKKFIPWLIMLPVLILLFAGILFLNRQSISLPVEEEPEITEDKIRAFTPEITDEFYIMEYDRHFGNWSEGYFIASMLVNAPDRSFSCIFPRQAEEDGLSSMEVKDLYQTLNLTEENIGERCLWKSFDSGAESLLFYGADSKEGVLMITRYGDIYVKGYRYLGDKKAFIEKLNGFIQGLEKEWLSKEDKDFLVETVETIEWK